MPNRARVEGGPFKCNTPWSGNPNWKDGDGPQSRSSSTADGRVKNEILPGMIDSYQVYARLLKQNQLATMDYIIIILEVPIANREVFPTLDDDFFAPVAQ